LLKELELERTGVLPFEPVEPEEEEEVEEEVSEELLETVVKEWEDLTEGLQLQRPPLLFGDFTNCNKTKKDKRKKKRTKTMMRGRKKGKRRNRCKPLLCHRER
jgi:hypothetical protein